MLGILKCIVQFCIVGSCFFILYSYSVLQLDVYVGEKYVYMCLNVDINFVLYGNIKRFCIFNSFWIF